VAQTNILYSVLSCPFQKLFCPSLKLKEKRRDGAKYVRRHHPPQTPYQRVMDHPAIPDDIKTALREQPAELNPFTIRAAIEAQLKIIFSNISVTSNVRHRF
jgi:hypothetical protein